MQESQKLRKGHHTVLSFHFQLLERQLQIFDYEFQTLRRERISIIFHDFETQLK